MPTKEGIVLAIGAHIWWKNEFEKAVSDGWHFFNPELAERSYQSELGFWWAELSADAPDSEPFRTVQARFADFHEATANVVRLASSGNIELAEASIRSGLFAQASFDLTLALRDWMQAVQADEPVHGLGTMQTPPPNPDPKRKQLGG
jgi:hypothetical protein